MEKIKENFDIEHNINLFIASCIQIELEEGNKIFKINKQKEMHLNYLLKLFVKYEDMKIKELLDEHDIKGFNDLNELIKNDKNKILENLTNINPKRFFSMVKNYKSESEDKEIFYECEEQESEKIQTEIKENDMIEDNVNNLKIDLKNNIIKKDYNDENDEIKNLDNNNELINNNNDSIIEENKSKYEIEGSLLFEKGLLRNIS
uniref:Uncharacterized protein n=1 Tax=Meloidogyne hapla TaxID=6305 RepID=A0A1I8B5D6_MELHA